MATSSSVAPTPAPAQERGSLSMAPPEHGGTPPPKEAHWIRSPVWRLTHKWGCTPNPLAAPHLDGLSKSQPSLGHHRSSFCLWSLQPSPPPDTCKRTETGALCAALGGVQPVASLPTSTRRPAGGPPQAQGVSLGPQLPDSAQHWLPWTRFHKGHPQKLTCTSRIQEWHAPQHLMEHWAFSTVKSHLVWGF